MQEAIGGKSLFYRLKQLYVVPANLRALVIACGLMAIQQLCGFNTLMYSSATLFDIVGFSNPTPLAWSWLERIGSLAF